MTKKRNKENSNGIINYLSKRDKENFDGVKDYLSLRKERDGKLSKQDIKPLAILMVIITILTFCYFGTTNTPETFWQSEIENEYVVLEIPTNATLGKVYVNANITDINNSALKVSVSNNLNPNSYIFKTQYKIDNWDMFRFNEITDLSSSASYKYLIFQLEEIKTRINEIVVLDSANQPIEFNIIETNAQSKDNGPTKIFDELETFNKIKSTNSMYFDEVYFARTAYEFIQDWTIYETTHPPLGKLIIAVGILIFGMNPVGWRIMGALFSIFAVFIGYLLGKRVFKSSKFGLAFGVFFACDGLRFVQGRMGTADSFTLVFLLLSFYFMYIFFEKGIDVNSIKRSMVPFALSGIFIGLAGSIKWNGAYGIIGLFVLFLITFIKFIKEGSLKLKDDLVSKEEKLTFRRRRINAIIMTIITGGVFFVIVPLGIYFSTFLVFKEEGVNFVSTFIEWQKNMFDYHSRLVGAHNSESGFWSWPLNGRSVYLFYGDSTFGKGMYSRIHSMSIPIISLFGIFSIVYFIGKYIYYFTKKKEGTLTKEEVAYFKEIKRPITFFGIGFLACWLPWIFISRSTFIYHFLLAMPFYIGIIVTYLYSKTMLERKIFYSGEFALLNGKKSTITYGQNKYIWALALAGVNFLLFYPVFTGLPISSFAAAFLFGWSNGFWGHGLFPSI